MRKYTQSRNHHFNKMKIYLLLSIISLSRCNWESEWLVPIQETYSRETRKNPSENVEFKIAGDETLGMTASYEDNDQKGNNRKTLYGVMNRDSPTSLTQKLRNTLHEAKALAETLKTQISSITSRENVLKEMIVTGRSGVTVLTLLLLGKLPRTYIIRDGFWTLCNGMVQYPTNGNGLPHVFNDLFAAPRCIGQEVSSRQDPCVFNSVVKYETVPGQRGIVYYEDEYLCLKSKLNQTLEQYLSVPKYIVNETCRDGTVRKLSDNSQQCGVRMMSEYTYYPQKSAATSSLPLEYCLEKDGACKLIVAWHISNASIEHFEFIKNDKGFKNFFMNTDVFNKNI